MPTITPAKKKEAPMQVNDVRLTPEYITLRRDRDRLQRLIAEQGVQAKTPAAVVHKKPTPTPHGSLNPTDGRSGKTSKVGT